MGNVGRPGRRGFLALAGVSVLVPSFAATACTSPTGRAGADHGGRAGDGPRDGSGSGAPPDPLRVRTDTGPLHKRFVALGRLTDAHWLGYDIDTVGQRETIPSPDARIRVVGVARPVRGAAEIVRSVPPAERFAPAALPADLPDPLVPYLPTRSGWQASTAYDLRVLAPASAASGTGTGPGAGAGSPGGERASGRFLLHVELDLVWFDTLFLVT
ncbi:hypothetical protein [Streptomyces sp. NPDC008121]|uniref:hypothetical protein n=1 Tax=Streptomyces sp. NPDC008121 TaxID=3364809 RepID=UPI0036E2305B